MNNTKKTPNGVSFPISCTDLLGQDQGRSNDPDM
nr:MAG TPA: hypothetical protein [Caudoviricetes sp.]